MSEQPEKKRRKRYSPEERRMLILKGAIQFFSDYGFDGSTHQLAKYLNVTQPLIYKYFPNKESLIEAVYEDLYNSRWNPDWDFLLSDRTRSLEDRLTTFYNEYSKVMHDPLWIRIYLYSGLRDLELNRRYNSLIEKRVIERLCAELRHKMELPGLADVPMTDLEFEAIWTLHGGLFYHGVRRVVYRLETVRNFDHVVAGLVRAFLDGFPSVTLGSGGPDGPAP